MAPITAVIALYVLVGLLALRFAPSRAGNEAEPY
jgi:hypothetical protein